MTAALAAPAEWPAGLGRAIERRLDQHALKSENIACLIADFASGQSVLSHWTEPEAPVPPGSLLKPFLALSYTEATGEAFPKRHCRGTIRGCWLPSGHGDVTLEAAIEGSCNYYFRRLADQVTAADVGRTVTRLGVPGPPADAGPPAFYGLSLAWRLAPEEILRAYRELAWRRRELISGRIWDGLRRAAVHGTAAGVGAASPSPAAAKTGTSACSHVSSPPPNLVDGYCLALYPAENPRYTILLQFHARTGRSAAEAAGIALQTLLGAS